MHKLQTKFRQFCMRIYFFDCYMHLIGFKLQRGMCSKIEIFQVQSHHNITLELLGMIFHKYIFLPGTNTLILEKWQRAVLWYLVKIQFWNGPMTSNYDLTSMNLRSRPWKNGLFKTPNVSMKCSGIHLFWEVCVCVYVRVCVHVCWYFPTKKNPTNIFLTMK